MVVAVASLNLVCFGGFAESAHQLIGGFGLDILAESAFEELELGVSWIFLERCLGMQFMRLMETVVKSVSIGENGRLRVFFLFLML